MKIIQVLNDFFPDTGGVQRVVLELSKALIRRGVEVEILCSTQPPNGEHGVFEDIPVTYTGHVFRVSQALISPKLVRRLWTGKADLVHSHLHPWSADWAALTGKLRKTPVVLTYHSDLVGSGWKRLVTGAYRGSLLRMTLSLADRIVVTTPDRLKVVPALRSFKKKVVSIPLGIDSSRFRPSKNSSGGETIGFLSLLRESHRYKGLEVLLEALQILNKREVPVTLKVGGDGDLLSYYRSLARNLGVDEIVDFVGFLPPLGGEVVDFYNSLDVFVLPSLDLRRENFGLVALEAAACGIPVVTTTGAGVAPLISEGGCGIVVSSGDTIGLADAIQNLLGDTAARIEMGRRGRGLAERLSWDKVAAEYEHLYEEVLSSGGGRPG